MKPLRSKYGDIPVVNVFVYGTLRPGQCLYDNIDHAVIDHIDEDEVEGVLHKSRQAFFPIASHVGDYHDNYAPNITGSVLRVREDYLHVLDQIEGVPNLFKRVVVKTKNGYEAFMYEGTGAEKGERIYTGDFVFYMTRMREF